MRDVEFHKRILQVLVEDLGPCAEVIFDDCVARNGFGVSEMFGKSYPEFVDTLVSALPEDVDKWAIRVKLRKLHPAPEWRANTLRILSEILGPSAEVLIDDAVKQNGFTETEMVPSMYLRFVDLLTEALPPDLDKQAIKARLRSELFTVLQHSQE